MDYARRVAPYEEPRRAQEPYYHQQEYAPRQEEYGEYGDYGYEDEGYMSEEEQTQFFEELQGNSAEAVEKLRKIVPLVDKQHRVITIFAIAIVFSLVLSGYALMMMDSNSTYHANSINNMVYLVNQTLINNGVTGLTREEIMNGEGLT